MAVTLVESVLTLALIVALAFALATLLAREDPEAVSPQVQQAVSVNLSPASLPLKQQG